VLIPKIVTALKDYNREKFAGDLVAGVIVGVVALPLAPARQRTRGFNQAHEIARRVARGIGRPLVAGLARTRDSPPQAALPAHSS